MARAPQKKQAGIPDRVTAPETGLSRKTIAAELNAIAKSGETDVRTQVLKHLKALLSEAKGFARLADMAAEKWRRSQTSISYF